MIYMRGQAADYDGWRQLGLPGWSWNDVLPAFLAHEDHIAPPNEAHRSGGEWRVEYPRVRWDILDAIRDACEAAGIPKIEDFNTGDNEGSAYFQVNQKRGRRWSAARGFLKPVLKRPNLRLETGAHVERVTFQDGRATGVVFSRGGERHHAIARTEVVLAAGAVVSPKLLELSGVGAGGRLRELGITVVRDAPGVGENLQDHLQLRPVYKVEGARTLNGDYARLWRRAAMGLEYALLRNGPLTMAPSQVGAFARSSPRYATANLQFHFQPLSLDKWGEGLHPFGAFTASIANLRPSSRGSVHAASPDPSLPPAIRPNYLSTEEDRRVAVEALRLTRRIVAQKPLERFQPREHIPGAAARQRRRSHPRGWRSRDDDLPSGRHGENGRRSRQERRARREAARSRRCRLAGDRCLRHAENHLRQHQLADAHDRREGGHDDARGRGRLTATRARSDRQ